MQLGRHIASQSPSKVHEVYAYELEVLKYVFGGIRIASLGTFYHPTVHNELQRWDYYRPRSKRVLAQLQRNILAIFRPNFPRS